MTKLVLTPGKKEALKRVSTESNLIGALAIDQRGALKRMLSGATEITQAEIEHYKELVSEELTPYASSILLDPEYGLPATKCRAKNAGLLLAYEKTGYDASEPGRFPDLIDIWSAKRIKDAGADAVKVLLYYDVDEGDAVNERKKAFIERVGSECQAEDILFFLEIVSYDATNDDVKSAAYARVKAHKVNEAMKEFSKAVYKVDVLKVEVPVNMDYVEGYATGEVVYSRQEALDLFKAQSDATHLPFIFLSAGVSAELFQETLRFAKEAGSTFNGVLCGRATWKDSVPVYAEQGEQACREFLRTACRKNIEDLNAVLEEAATPWSQRVE